MSIKADRLNQMPINIKTRGDTTSLLWKDQTKIL